MNQQNESATRVLISLLSLPPTPLGLHRAQSWALMLTIFKVFIDFVTILFLFGFFVHEVPGILVPWPGMEGEVLTTGLPEKSLNRLFHHYTTKNRNTNGKKKISKFSVGEIIHREFYWDMKRFLKEWTTPCMWEEAESRLCIWGRQQNSELPCVTQAIESHHLNKRISNTPRDYCAELHSWEAAWLQSDVFFSDNSAMVTFSQGFTVKIRPWFMHLSRASITAWPFTELCFQLSWGVTACFCEVEPQGGLFIG